MRYEIRIKIYHHDQRKEQVMMRASAWDTISGRSLMVTRTGKTVSSGTVMFDFFEPGEITKDALRKRMDDGDYARRGIHMASDRLLDIDKFRELAPLDMAAFMKDNKLLLNHLLGSPEEEAELAVPAEERKSSFVNNPTFGLF